MSKIHIANRHDKAQGQLVCGISPAIALGVSFENNGDSCAIGTDEAIATFDGHPVRKYNDVAAKRRRHPK